MGIGPTQPAWKAGVLPLNYTRVTHNACIFYQIYSLLSNDFTGFFKKNQSFFYILFTAFYRLYLSENTVFIHYKLLHVLLLGDCKSLK